MKSFILPLKILQVTFITANILIAQSGQTLSKDSLFLSTAGDSGITTYGFSQKQKEEYVPGPDSDNENEMTAPAPTDGPMITSAAADVEEIGEVGPWNIPELGWMYRYLGNNSFAPSGSKITNVEYRIRIGDKGSPSTFYAGDYEIWLSSSTSAGVNDDCLVYDNLGGRTDGGYDDDSADDSDIYLYWRSTNCFDGEDPNQYWGIKIYDRFSGDSGELNYFYFRIYYDLPSADLALTGLTVSPSTVTTRAFTGTSFNIVNYGPAALSSEGVMVDYYLSNDVTFGDADDVKIGDTGFTLSIGSGSSQSISLNSTGRANMVRFWPENHPAGNYYVFARVNITDGTPTDPSSGNNYDRTNSTITYSPPPKEPDLTRSTSDLTVNGTTVAISVTVINNGDGDAGSSELGYYLSTNTTISTSDHLIGTDYVTGLSPSATSTESISIDVMTVSPAIPAGTYYVGYFIDHLGQVSESNENDNDRYWSTPQVTIPGPPTVTTEAVTDITTTSVSLHGTINPNGASTDYYFEYGTSTSYGSQTSTQPAGSGSNAVSFSISLSGLSQGTTYHVRLVASNVGGTQNGNDITFTTPNEPVATAVTGAATNISTTSATLNGTVNPNGSSTTYYFKYGTNSNYGTQTSSQNGGSGTSTVQVSENIIELTANTTYHFQLVTSNSGGTAEGADQTFTTGTLGIDDQQEVPISFELHPAYPNPFNPKTSIGFALPQSTRVSLIVYDLWGREISRLIDESMGAGHYQIQWNGKSSNGETVPSGVYIVRLSTREYVNSIKLVLMK